MIIYVSTRSCSHNALVLFTPTHTPTGGQKTTTINRNSESVLWPGLRVEDYFITKDSNDVLTTLHLPSSKNCCFNTQP